MIGRSAPPVCRERCEKPVQEDEGAEGPGIDDAGRLEPGEEFRGGADGLFQPPDDPVPPRGIVRRRLFFHGLNQGVEDRQHRAGPRVVDRLPGPVPALPDRIGHVFEGVGHEEAREEPGGDVARVPPRRKEKLPDGLFPSPGDPAEGGEADDEVPARIAVGHGKDVDLVEEVRPGGDALDAGDQGRCKGRIHVSPPGPG